MLKKILLALAVLIWALPALGEMIVDTAWIRRYNGAANGEDHAHSMAVDALGNVYVTGYSLGNETYFDYTTIKYRPNGDTAWVRRYNGTANAADVAHDVAVDDSGNVYVTGRSEGAGTYDDVVTVKYDSLGNQIWVQRQDGPISGYDRGYALALDRLGNVYVAGSSHGDGTSDDCITVAYAADGSELWCSRYNRVGSGQDWAFDVA
jgi:alpha-tubulin suppressor-like RCC1 family protein